MKKYLGINFLEYVFHLKLFGKVQNLECLQKGHTQRTIAMGPVEYKYRVDSDEHNLVVLGLSVEAEKHGWLLFITFAFAKHITETREVSAETSGALATTNGSRWSLHLIAGTDVTNHNWSTIAYWSGIDDIASLGI